MARTGTATGTVRWHRGRWTTWNGKRRACALYAVRPERLRVDAWGNAWPSVSA